MMSEQEKNANPSSSDPFEEDSFVSDFKGVAEEGVCAHAGSPLSEGQAHCTMEDVVEALKEIYDPEIPVNLYDLGLIYDVKLNDKGDVDIVMSLTTPMCPVAGELPQQVADRVSIVPGVGCVEVLLTWDPPWDMSRMSEDAKLGLGYFE